MAAGDIILSDGTTITPEDLQKIAAAVTELINTNAKDPGQWEEVTSLQGITSLPVFQVVGATYKLVKVAVEILRGTDGREVELSVNQDKTYIQWRYTDGMWSNLIAVADLKGDPGETPEFRKGETGVEWKYQSESEWNTLIPFSELKWNFSDLTPEQIEQLWDNLPENILQEFQRPATEAAQSANAAAQSATQAAQSANAATQAATEATTQAQDATQKANTATEAAKTATQEATAATEAAKTATESAKTATGEANTAAQLATTATDNANTATAATNEAIQKANEATNNTNAAISEANAATQRANEAAEAAEGVLSGIRPDWLAGKESQNYIKNKPEIPTLASAPTEDTLTYINTDGTEVSYKIGDLVRYFDAEDAEDYVFYQLYDIADGKAKWKLGGSGGGGDVREKVKINLTSNQPQPDNSLIGATISVVDTGTMQSLYDGTWQGAEIKVNISPLLNVRVTVGEVEGYATPAEQTFETVIQGERNLSFVYNACLVTVNATTNQSEHTDVAGAQITVAYDSVQKTVSSGESVKVPLGKSYTVTASDIQYYQTPSAQQLTAETASKDVSVVYNTCVLTVNVTGVDFGDRDITVKYDSVTQTLKNGASVKVPYGESVTVSCPDIENYAKPSDVVFTPSEASKTVSMEYVESALRLSIDSNQSDKGDIAGLKATVTWSGGTVQVGDGETVAIPVGTEITITFPDVEGYKKPDNIVFTHNGGLAEKSGLYQTEVVTVTLSAYDSSSVSGQKVTINSQQYTYSAPVTVKIPFGTTYSVSADAKDGYEQPETQQFTANQVSRSVSLVYQELAMSVITLNQAISDPDTMVGGDVNGEVIKWIRQNSHRVLAKKTAEGKVTYCRLNDNNSNQYYDGSAAKLDGSEGDVMLILPAFSYCGTEGDNVDITFSKKPFDNSVEWDSNILIGVYESVMSGNKAYSKSGVVSTGSISQRDWGTYAAARGKGYQLVDWQMHCVLGCLYYAMYGNTNCQATIGAGTSAYNKVCGQTDTLGMTDTQASTNGNKQSINFWGLENWWGNKYEWMEEDQVNPSSKKFTVYDPVTKGTRIISFKYFNGWYVKKMKFGRYLDLINTENDNQRATDSTSYCDNQYWPNSGSTRVVRRSGYNRSTVGGVACTDADGDSSYTFSDCSSRLAFRGECTEAESVAAFKALPVL